RAQYEGPELPSCALERGDDACPYERRLALARRPRDGDELLLAELAGHHGDLVVAPEEPRRVRLLERREAGEGALVLGEHRGPPHVRADPIERLGELVGR